MQVRAAMKGAAEEAQRFSEECINAADTLAGLQENAGSANQALDIGTAIQRYNELKQSLDNANLLDGEGASLQKELIQVEQQLGWTD